jgi:hypothetical protein
MKHWLLACVIALYAGACSVTSSPDVGSAAGTLAEFESQLDDLRSQLAIPGMMLLSAHTVITSALATSSASAGLSTAFVRSPRAFADARSWCRSSGNDG